MIILAIETSCDETSIAVLKFEKGEVKILSNIISSQVKLHAKYGGVYPSLAKREHQKNLPAVLKKSLKEAKDPKIDIIAVTVGPGLEPCLWQGVNFAKELAQKLNLPIIPVNHTEAHILANFLNSKTELPFMEAKVKMRTKSSSPLDSKHLFPAVCLVVSGGHTQLILMRDFGEYKILGETRDDAAGECFDKAARILGLGYPGGPVIAAEAAKYKTELQQEAKVKMRTKFSSPFKIQLPRPMISQKNYDFSFSGLKTAALYDFKKRTPGIRKSLQYIREMCFEVQQAIIDVLTKKTIKAAKDYGVKSIILGGGVVANEELRRQFKEKIEKQIPYSKFYIPPSKFCTDNAAIVGIAAYFNRFKKNNWQKITANANLRLGK